MAKITYSRPLSQRTLSPLLGNISKRMVLILHASGECFKGVLSKVPVYALGYPRVLNLLVWVILG